MHFLSKLVLIADSNMWCHVRIRIFCLNYLEMGQFVACCKLVVLNGEVIRLLQRVCRGDIDVTQSAQHTELSRVQATAPLAGEIVCSLTKLGICSDIARDLLAYVLRNVKPPCRGSSDNRGVDMISTVVHRDTIVYRRGHRNLPARPSKMTGAAIETYRPIFHKLRFTAT